MADEKPRFYTLRKHRKKSVFFAAIGCWLVKYGVDRFREYVTRRQLCEEAKVYAQDTTPALQKPRRFTVFFNATAGKGDAEKLFKRNAEPILHLAGLDVTIIKTDYEGQIKTLMQYVDPSIDGILVAGGDGTLLEAVTGLLRRSDQEQVSKIPFGVIPIGSQNSFFQRIFGKSKVAQAREIGEAVMAIVKGDICSTDVMEIKGQEGRSTFAMSSIHWGAFRDAAVSYDKYWWTGPFRKKMAYIATTLKGWPPTHQATLVYHKPETPSKSRLSASGNLVSPGLAANSMEYESDTSKTDKIINNNEDHNEDHSWVHTSVQTLGVSVELDKNNKGNTILNVTIWPSDLSKMDFIKRGWEMLNKEEINYNDYCTSLQVLELTLEPKVDIGSWFSIDGEPFDARPICIKLHQDKLKLFSVKRT